MKGIDTVTRASLMLTSMSRRNEFPEVKGIDTSRYYLLKNKNMSRNEFPEVKGIDTL